MQRHAKTCKDMNFSGTFPSDVMNRKGWCEVNRLLGRSVEFIHWFIQFKLDLKRANGSILGLESGNLRSGWVESRFTGFSLQIFFRNRNGNSEISHLLKLRNLPKVLPRQHLEPQKHEAYVRNFNHLPNDFPKFAYKHWHSITNFYLLHTIYIQVNDLWDASTEPLNNSCFLESWRSYLWYALGKSSGHAFGSGSKKLYTVVQ